MPFIRNAWYAAAWSHEVGEQLFARRILGDAVLIYRTTDGTASAIADLCPHRFAPLHLGRRIDGTIECGYHGLRFDQSGRCVLNPYAKQAISKSLNVRGFPLLERHGVLWIWTGTPELAEASMIPNFGHLTADAHKSVTGSMMIRANYELIIDNLMDTSHGQYLHQELVASGTLDPSNFTVTHDDAGSVSSTSLFPNVEVPANYRPFLPSGRQRADRTLTFQWFSPSVTFNRSAFVPVGGPAHEGIERIGTHLLTPETETSTHYLFAHTRNFRLDDAGLDETTREWQRTGLDGQDRPMIEAVQANMLASRNPAALRPVLLAPDMAAVWVHRILAKLIEAERAVGTGGTEHQDGALEWAP